MDQTIVPTLKLITYGLIVITALQILATMGYVLYRYVNRYSTANRRQGERRFFERRVKVRPSRYRERRIAERRHAHI